MRVLALCLFLCLIACGPSPVDKVVDAGSLHKGELTIPSKDADAAWGRLQAWLSDNCQMKIQTATSNLISTYNATKQGDWGAQASRAEMSDGETRIKLRVAEYGGKKAEAFLLAKALGFAKYGEEFTDEQLEPHVIPWPAATSTYAGFQGRWRSGRYILTLFEGGKKFEIFGGPPESATAASPQIIETRVLEPGFYVSVPQGDINVKTLQLVLDDDKHLHPYRSDGMLQTAIPVEVRPEVGSCQERVDLDTDRFFAWRESDFHFIKFGMTKQEVLANIFGSVESGNSETTIYATIPFHNKKTQAEFTMTDGVISQIFIPIVDTNVAAKLAQNLQEDLGEGIESTTIVEGLTLPKTTYIWKLNKVKVTLLITGASFYELNRGLTISALD